MNTNPTMISIVFGKIVEEAERETLNRMKKIFSEEVVKAITRLKENCLAERSRYIKTDDQYTDMYNELKRIKNGKSGDGFRIINPQNEVDKTRESDKAHLERIDKMLEILTQLVGGIVCSLQKNKT